MAKSSFKNTRKLINNIKKLEVCLPQEADQKYFTTLENKIMHGIDGLSCKDVRESLVDLFEDSLSPERAKEINEHISLCKECKEEYKTTANLISSLSKIETKECAVDDYFTNLAEKITEKAFENRTPETCTTAQDYLVNILMEEEIPADIKKHIDSCEGCQQEMKMTEKMMESLKRFSVPLPNEQYFEAQLNKIDAAIELLPSPRIAKSQQREKISNYVISIFDTIRITILQPQAAIAVSALVALLIIGGRMYYRQDSIEERQINLSEVINKTNSIASRAKFGAEDDHDRDRDHKTTIKIDTATASRSKLLRDNISDPREDEKLEIKASGTAEVKNKNKKLN
ncbi:MAG: zf-HC2 domain-containing protein [bacterium]